ncbi:MAG: hypothetical protein ACYDH4_00445 [Candidatus Cryosericum sp.]
MSPWLLIAGLAGMPPLYFFFAGLWMKNYVVLIPCTIFGIAHVAITCSTYSKSSSALPLDVTPVEEGFPAIGDDSKITPQK